MQSDEPTSQPAALTQSSDSVYISDESQPSTPEAPKRQLCSYPSVNSLPLTQSLAPISKAEQLPEEATPAAMHSPTNSRQSSLTTAGSYSSALGFPLSLPKIEGAFLAAAQNPPRAASTCLQAQQSGTIAFAYLRSEVCLHAIDRCSELGLSECCPCSPFPALQAGKLLLA